MTTKKLTQLALFIALGLVLAWLEAILIPPIGIPGVKLGLANLIALIALYLFGWREAAVVTFARLTLGALLFGSLSGLLYGFSGALLAVPGMILLKKTNRFSCVGVSCAGAVLHNMGQLLSAAIVARTPGLGAYLPVLILSGVAMGTINGMIARIVLRRFS